MDRDEQLAKMSKILEHVTALREKVNGGEINGLKDDKIDALREQVLLWGCIIMFS